MAARSFGPIHEAARTRLGAAALLGAWWLWWRLPKRQVDRLNLKIRDPKARADVEDNFRKTIGQLFGAFHPQRRRREYRASESPADLSDAHFREALLSAMRRAANLSDAILDRANLNGAIVSQDQLDKACGSDAALNHGLIFKRC